MGRGVGTMVVTELAIVAFFFHLPIHRRSQFGEITLMFINAIKKGIKRRTQIKTSSASITDIKNAMSFLLQLGTWPFWSEKVEAFHNSPSLGSDEYEREGQGEVNPRLEQSGAYPF